MKQYLASLAVMGYVVLTATQGVALGALVQRSIWNSVTLMVATFFVVIVVFNLAQLGRAATYLRLVRASAKEVAWLNLLSAVNFVSFYWAIRSVPVSSHAAIALGVGPLVVLLFSSSASRNRWGDWVSALGLAASLVLMASSIAGRASSFDIAMSFVCGASLVFTLFSQRRLKAAGWSPDQMMAARFFALLVVGVALNPNLPVPSIAPEAAILHVLLLGVFGTIIPLYLLTWGQCHTKPLTSTLLLYTMPLLMVAGELIEARVTVSPLILGGIFTTCVFLAIGYLSKLGGTSVNESAKPIDCAIVVGGHSSGAIYSRKFNDKGIPTVHVPAAPRPPAAYASQPLPSEFVADLPFDEKLEDTLSRLREHPLSGFCPRYVVAGTDQGVGRADALAERLGLLSNGSGLSAIRRDKYLTAERLRERGLNAPLQFRTSDPEAAADWVRRHPEVSRWVVKPTRSAGSDRVASCRTPEEVLAAARVVVGGTNVFGESDDAVLVQEYLTSPDDDNEYVVNTCTISDPETGRVEHRVVSIYRYEKITANGADFIYYSRDLLPPNGQVQDTLADYFLRCLDALEIRQGPCHGELRMTKRGPALVEANVGRPDGGGVPKLDAVCTGNDQVTLTVESLLAPESYRGGFAQPYRLLKQGRVAFFVCRRGGVLRAIPGLQRLRSLPSFVDAVFLAEPGKPVSPTVDVTSLLGWAFLANADRQALEADYAILREMEAAGDLFDIE